MKDKMTYKTVMAKLANLDKVSIPIDTVQSGSYGYRHNPDPLSGHTRIDPIKVEKMDRSDPLYGATSFGGRDRSREKTEKSDPLSGRTVIPGTDKEVDVEGKTVSGNVENIVEKIQKLTLHQEDVKRLFDVVIQQGSKHRVQIPKFKEWLSQLSERTQ